MAKLHNDKNMKEIGILAVVFMVLTLGFTMGCGGSRKQFSDNTPPEMLVYRADNVDIPLEIHFQRGRQHNHPLMVFWLEDQKGNYIQTLFVAASIGKGMFRYGAQADGHWMPGEIQRPASLPYWAHKRGILNEQGYYIPSPGMPVPDAITGPTPKRNFILLSGADNLPEKFRVMMEINQTWDFNEYWTNGKFPGNMEYMTSCQPALVYEAVVDLNDGLNEYLMKPIGHSHFDGSNGSLTADLSTITTALDIAREIKVVLP